MLSSLVLLKGVMFQEELPDFTERPVRCIEAFISIVVFKVLLKVRTVLLLWQAVQASSKAVPFSVTSPWVQFIHGPAVAPVG